VSLHVFFQTFDVQMLKAAQWALQIWVMFHLVVLVHKELKDVLLALGAFHNLVLILWKFEFVFIYLINFT
jgi:hypothetical protein